MAQTLFIALVGAAITVVVGWIANWVRAGTETHQWERQTLHDAYESFLAAHEHMLTLFGRTTSSKQVDLAMGWRDVSERAARMQLLAPVEIVAAADKLIKALATYQLADDAYKMMAVAAQKDPSKWDKGLAQTYSTFSDKHADAKASFIEAARTDLLRRRSFWPRNAWIEGQTTRVIGSVQSKLQRGH